MSKTMLFIKLFYSVFFFTLYIYILVYLRKIGTEFDFPYKRVTFATI